MAANYVEILVKSRDDAKPDIDDLRAKLEELKHTVAEARVNVKDADAAARLDRLQAKLIDLGNRVAKPDIKVTGALRAEAEIHAVEAALDRLNEKAAMAGPTGLIGKILGGVAGFGGGPGGLASMGAGFAVLAPAIAAVVVEVTALASGFAAAAAGAGAFYALAKPAAAVLSQNFQQFHQAVIDYQNASQNLGTAISSSSADMKNYQATIKGMEPDLAAAAKLLTDQGVQWQNLSPKMQNALIALSNNKAELKAMLPDQKAALKALLEQGDALGNLDPAGQKAVGMMQSLSAEFNKIQAAFEPTAFKVFGDALKIVSQLLPSVLPFAQTFGNVLDGLLQKVSKFAASKGFQDWLKQFHSLEGPALTAIGQGIGNVANALGHLLTIMSSKDVAHAINIAFDTIAGAIRVLTVWIHGLMNNWDSMSSAARRNAHEVAQSFDSIRHSAATLAHDIAAHFDEIRHAIAAWVMGVIHDGAKVIDWFSSLPGKIASALASLPGKLLAIGVAIIQGLVNGILSMAGAVLHAVEHIAGLIPSAFSTILHIFSPSRVMHAIGQNIMQGLMDGMASKVPELRGQMAGISGVISGGIRPGGGYAGAGYGGGGTLRLEVAGGGSAAEQAIVYLIRNYVRIRGGNVQAAFGH